ncbi:MAG: response regulator transcription factor [Theionarchaea archaeon]|nr:response regulator transcription factor [Theionarchaea archaeon]
MGKFSDEELLELYQQGLTNREIARELKVSQASVHYRLEKLGLTNNCHQDQDVDLNKVQILHGMGLTSIGIALVLKTSAAVISQHIKELGLEDNCIGLRELTGSEVR